MDTSSSRRFTTDEVDAIVRRALTGQRSEDTISHEELLEIAEESGISSENLQRAIDEHEREDALEEARAIWRDRRRRKFYAHLRTYLIVNGVLLLANLFTSPRYMWVVWPILGWGLGLLFDASEAFFPKESVVERGAHKVLKQKRGKVETV